MKKIYFIFFLFFLIKNIKNEIGIVNTECGPIKGIFEREHNIWSFRGIPFAVPPKGILRWKPPKDLKESNNCWKGTLNGQYFRNMCIQSLFNTIVGDEDCLFLNIWTKNIPSVNNSNNMSLIPVMVYIHGGGLMSGSGAIPTQLPWRIASQGEVISVSINYRLNAFGFLSLDILSKNNPRNISGNYGFLDQIQALKWIQKNIKYFGGDPSKVTIWGQSSGGTSILALLLSPLASNLFSRAISMSASPLIASSLKEAEHLHINDFLKNSRCYQVDITQLLHCLYSLTPKEIISSISNSWNPNWLFGIPKPNDTISPLPVIDGFVLPFNSTFAFSKGLINKVPIILGVMHDEPDVMPVDVVLNYTSKEFENFIKNKFSLFNKNFGNDVLELYPLHQFVSPQQCYDSISADIGDICGNLKLAQLLSPYITSPLYFYIATQFPYKPMCLDDAGVYCSRYAFHTFDLDVVNHDGLLLYPQDIQFGDMIRKKFIEFAKTGFISSWKPFYKQNQSDYYVISLDLNEKILINAKKEKCKFWTFHGFNKFWWQN